MPDDLIGVLFAAGILFAFGVWYVILQCGMCVICPPVGLIMLYAVWRWFDHYRWHDQ